MHCEYLLFGNPATSLKEALRLCVPVLQQVCLFVASAIVYADTCGHKLGCHRTYKRLGACQANKRVSPSLEKKGVWGFDRVCNDSNRSMCGQKFCRKPKESEYHCCVHLASDYIHPAPREGRCRVRIYLPEDEQDAPVVICSELPSNEGSSVTYSHTR
jgi:hypothetical protein